MKKVLRIFFIAMISLTVLVGCSRKITNNSQSTDAYIDQFASPKVGDTVAEFVIKDYGSIYVRFFEELAPKAVENFTTHAKDGYYDGLTFHRVIEDFMIQGGDPKGTGTGGESIWDEEFEDEFADYLQPYRGALCMANGGPDTNGSQFFLVQSKQVYDEETIKKIEQIYDISFNETAIETYDEVGGTPWLFKLHTVFGQVYEGLNVLDAIAKVKVDNNDKPLENVIIDKINIFEYQ